MLKIDRQDAARLGRKTYRTGKPCRNGHDSFRYVSTGQCVACMADRYAQAVRLADKPQNVTYRLRASDVAEVNALVLALYLQRGETPPALPAIDGPVTGR